MEGHQRVVQALLHGIEGIHGYGDQEQHFVPFSRPPPNCYSSCVPSDNPFRRLPAPICPKLSLYEPIPAADQRIYDSDIPDDIQLDQYGTTAHENVRRANVRQIKRCWPSRAFNHVRIVMVEPA